MSQTPTDTVPYAVLSIRRLMILTKTARRDISRYLAKVEDQLYAAFKRAEFIDEEDVDDDDIVEVEEQAEVVLDAVTTTREVLLSEQHNEEMLALLVDQIYMADLTGFLEAHEIECLNGAIQLIEPYLYN